MRVTVTADVDELPASLSALEGRLVCLACRRAIVSERAKAAHEGSTPAAIRRHVTRALVRDELGRDPDRTDRDIAKSLGGVSATVVGEIRKQLAEGRS